LLLVQSRCLIRSFLRLQKRLFQICQIGSERIHALQGLISLFLKGMSVNLQPAVELSTAFIMPPLNGDHDA
jgi:hypothetical protein